MSNHEHLDKAKLQERIDKAIKDINVLEKEAKQTKNKFSHFSTIWNSYLTMYFNVLLLKDCPNSIKSLNSLTDRLNNPFGNGLVDLHLIHCELHVIEFNVERMRYSFDAIQNTLDDFQYYFRNGND